MKKTYRKPHIKRLTPQQEPLLTVASLDEVNNSGFEDEEDDLDIDDTPQGIWGR